MEKSLPGDFGVKKSNLGVDLWEFLHIFPEILNYSHPNSKTLMDGSEFPHPGVKFHEKIGFLESFHHFYYFKTPNGSNFPGFSGKKELVLPKAEKYWKKEYKNQHILGKYLGKIKVFWR